MYFRVVVALFAARAFGADDLVAVIKHDLQANNDDYLDLRRARALSSPPRSSVPPSTSSAALTDESLLTTTTDDSVRTTPTPDTAPKFFIPLNKKPQFHIPLPSLFRRSRPNDTHDETSGRNYPEKTTTLDVVKVASWHTRFATRPKIKKIELIISTKSVLNKTRRTFHPEFRAKQFFNQGPNDLLFHERFRSGKGIEKSLPRRVKSLTGIDKEYYEELDDFMKLGSRLKGQVAKVGNALAIDKWEKPVMRANWRQKQRIRAKGRQQLRGRGNGHGHTRVRGVPNAELPDAEVLDMAPARGARVYSKRLRHRLCSRSALNPEGPKYNSAGQVYINQFTPRGQGHFGFNHTRAPRLLLPRCCNCCKKSVLGCE